MRLKRSNARLMTKTAVALGLAASVSIIGVGCATQIGGAATKATTARAATGLVIADPSRPSGREQHERHRGCRGQSKRDSLLRRGRGYQWPQRRQCQFDLCKGTKGYDCMSLAQYAVYQGTGHKVVLPNDGARPTGGTFIGSQGTVTADQNTLLPGDAVFFGGTISDYHHSGIYAGNDEVWDALSPGTSVAEHSFSDVYSSYGNVYDGAYRYTATASSPLSITTKTLHRGVTGTSYSVSVHATGGSSPYTWTRVGSKLPPPGLHLATTGVISGKATEKGTYTFEVRVVDHSSPRQSAEKALSIKIT